mmetsp:Transcript_22833/g.42618  ORF Transcript_22833/g.42618 Transcript_22833/m.42618 type:complete len:637 (+) Transcript_22833:11-1921(+)
MKSAVFVSSLAVGSALTGPLDSYLKDSVPYANSRIENAINTDSGVGGTNVATKDNIAGNNEAALSTGVGGTPDDWCPNYQYSWLRDQALVMSTVMDKYATSPAGSDDSAKYEEILKGYASNAHQVYDMNDNPLWFNSEGRPWSHAEAKYELNGQMYTGGWCSPQNDGPALRSVVLMRFANRYTELHPSDTSYVRENLYSNSTDVGVKNPIKRDLEFLFNKPQLVATNPDRYTGYWDSDNCEPWEEVSGKHFYNRLMARRAMVRGAEFATAQGDAGAGDAYASAIADITSAVDSHWNPSLNTIMPTNNDNRFDDIQTVFASLHSHAEDDSYFVATDSKVLANAYYTLNSFRDYYNINNIGYNNAPLSLGLALGRYTGDVYNGGCNYDDSVCPSPCSGQPWFLATNAMGELIYKAVALWKSAPISIDDTNKNFFEYFNIKYSTGSYAEGSTEHTTMLTVLMHAADSFLQRTQYHTNDIYRLDEQYNQDTGAMMSAGDLVWSYASLVTASGARDSVDPASTFASLNSGSSVLQEFVISDFDTSSDSSKPVYRIVGNTPSLGDGDACSSGFEDRTPSKRRCGANGACDYSIVLEVPKNTQVEWQMVRTNDDCSSFEVSSSTTVIAADNNGVDITTASWSM